MTPDAQGPGPDDTPIPPAQTRWSEEAVDEDDGLMPPFIPGATDRTPVESAARDAGEQGGDEPFPFEADAEDEPFPFETEAEDEAFSREADADEEPFPFEAEADEEPFPFEDQQAAEPSSTGPSTTEPEVADTPEDAFPFDATEPAEADDFPFDAFDLGGEPGSDPATQQPGSLGAVEPMSQAQGGGSVTELADRLEWLAQTLRTEGRVGLEREAATGGPVTSLVAAVLVGYLAGRGD